MATNTLRGSKRQQLNRQSLAEPCFPFTTNHALTPSLSFFSLNYLFACKMLLRMHLRPDASAVVVVMAMRWRMALRVKLTNGRHCCCPTAPATIPSDGVMILPFGPFYSLAQTHTQTLLLPLSPYIANLCFATFSYFAHSLTQPRWLLVLLFLTIH